MNGLHTLGSEKFLTRTVNFARVLPLESWPTKDAEAMSFMFASNTNIYFSDQDIRLILDPVWR
jgi:hypothetical protein